MSFASEAGWDRIARVALGIVLLYLGWAEVVTGGWGTALQIIGFVPLATGLLGWCPLYQLFGFRPTPRRRNQPRSLEVLPHG